MKTIEIYPGRIVQAYQEKDLPMLRHAGLAAEHIWLEEWERQGCRDEGSCCLGKGFEVYFLPPRAKRPQTRMIARCDFVQGNVSAYKTAGPVRDFLKDRGIMADYNDGVMD